MSPPIEKITAKAVLSVLNETREQTVFYSVKLPILTLYIQNKKETC